MKDGEVVEFDAGDEYLLAAVLRNLGDKYIVLTEEGDEMRPTDEEIEYALGRTLDTGHEDERLLSELASLRDEIDEIAAEVDVPFLWEFVRDDGEVTPRSLCELFFESQRPVEVAATRQRLREDDLYFKRRKEGFEPRSESQIEQLRQQLEARRERRRLRREFVEGVVELLECDEEERERRADERMGEPEFRERAETLQQYAIHDQDYEEREEALELLESIEEQLDRDLPGSWGDKAFRLMVELGVWDEHENLWLHRYNLGGRPDDEVLEAADEIEVEGWEPEDWRADFTDRRCFSIDDPETRDIDDALSCRRIGDGHWEVGIHVADPSTFVDPGDELDEHARKRGTSIYLPSKTIPMFPETVSEEVASLVAGAVRPAVSVIVEFDDEEVVDQRIEPSVVRVDARLTYDEADTLLEAGDDPDGSRLATLQQLAEASRQRRVERGALAIDLPDPEVRVSKQGDELEVECTVAHRDSTAHELVSEFMVLANTVIGKFCRERGVPVIYRSQPSPDGPLDDEHIQSRPEGLPRKFAKLRRMKPGNLTTEPSSHFGLGVSAYAQATSPIRRYADLICQRQLKAELAGEPFPYDEDDIVELLGTVETTSRRADRVQHETERYWLLEFLRRNADRAFEATVVEHKNSDGTHAAVWLDAVAQKFNCNLRKSVPPGESVEVVVESVEPRSDRISLRQA